MNEEKFSFSCDIIYIHLIPSLCVQNNLQSDIEAVFQQLTDNV